MTGNEFGFGLPLTKRLLHLGHQVIAVGRHQNCLDQAKEECPSLITILADINDEEQRQRLVGQVSSQYPRINVLINNAGIRKVDTPFLEFSESDWTGLIEEMNANLLSQMWMTCRMLPHLLERRASAIINVSTALAIEPDASCAGYCAFKGEGSEIIFIFVL